MKDLDFDELDRAVNSLMTNATKAKPDEPVSEEAGQEKTLDITPTLNDGATPSFDKLSEATAKTADAATLQPQTQTPEVSAAASTAATEPKAAPRQAGPLPAFRRGGRFMDVVHPSANMKKPEAPARVSRQGVTVAPLSTPKEEPEQSQQQNLEPAEAAPAQPSEPEKPTPLAVPSRPPVEPHAAAKSDWPDPLEVAGFTHDESKDEPAAKSPSQESPVMPEKTDVPKNSPTTDETEDPTATPDETSSQKPENTESEPPKDDADQSPLTSPFLSDAKVEKRPLGGVAPSEEVEEPGHAPVLGAASEEKKSVNDPAAQLPASPEEVELELPEELQGDLVAIEADTSTHPQPAPETTDKKEEPGEPVANETKTPAPQPARDQDEKRETAGPTSIPQQYREEPSTGSKDNGAIYDTSTYHQPLAHPDKKKSGWLVVVWIVAILLLGAGGGAALYLLGVV